MNRLPKNEYRKGMRERRANPNPIRPGSFMRQDWLDVFLGTIAFAAILATGYFAVVLANLIIENLKP